MKHQVEILGEELSDITTDEFIISQPENFSDNSLNNQIHLRSFQEISNSISSEMWQRKVFAPWEITSSEQGEIKVSNFSNYTTNTAIISGHEALQYLMQQALDYYPIETEAKIQCIKDVMGHGVDINKPYKKLFKHREEEDEITPLSQAAGANDIVLVKFLMNKGAQVTPPVLRAIAHGVTINSKPAESTITFLMERGVDINMADEHGGIMHKIFFGMDGATDFTCFLLKNGLDHRIVDKDGRSILHKAVENLRQDQAIALVQNGADLYLKDNKGITPFDLVPSYSSYFGYRLELFYKKYQESIKESIEVINLNIIKSSQLSEDALNDSEISIKEVILNQPNTLSDELLEKQYNQNGLKHLLPNFMLNSYDQQVRKEYDKRVTPKEFSKKQIEGVNLFLDNLSPNGKTIKVAVKKFTGLEIGTNNETVSPKISSPRSINDNKINKVPLIEKFNDN